MIPVQLVVGTAEDLNRLLLDRLVQLTGSRSVRLGHSCPGCGSDQHGRPVVLGAAIAPHVSLTRDRDRRIGVAAVCFDSPVGVDVEGRGAADFEGFDELVLHPAESAYDQDERTRLWVRKEAWLKCRGVGLARDPRSIAVQAAAPGIVDVDLGPGWSCAVALSDGAPEVWAARAG